MTTWARFESYRIQHGHIVPSPEPGPLKVTDPWAEYARARSGRREEAPPYQSLIRLLHRAQRDGHVEPDRATLRAITSWCGRHGLLGVLPAQLREAAVAYSTYERVGEVSAGRGPMMPQPFKYLQTSSGWQKVEIDLQHLPAANYVVMASFDGRTREEDPSKNFARFFPRQGANALELTPLSLNYWRAYGEPVADFLDAGTRLLAALEAVERSRRTPDDEGSAVMTLRRLLGFATREPVLRDRRVTWTWTVPSLISAFAGMVLEDLCAGRRLLRCAECKAPFLTGAHQARYCMVTCRNTHLVRKRRARARLEHVGDHSRKQP